MLFCPCCSSASLRCAGSQEAREIGHIAAAQEKAAAVGGVADELGDPSNYLAFHFGSHGSQVPGADIRVYRSGLQVCRSASIPMGAAVDVM